MSNYYATSKNMIIQNIRKLDPEVVWMEYNPNIRMYRINSSGQLPRELLGYSPHRKALVIKAMKVFK